MTDNIPPAEMARIFKRLSTVIRFGRVQSQRETRGRIQNKIKFYREVMSRAKRESTSSRYRGKFMKLRTLDRHRVDRRIWNDAKENPGSIYDLTLRYGREGAEERLKAEARRRAGRMRRLRRTRERM